MTIVSFSHNFAYIHVPKTAGTSVTNYFAKYLQAGDVRVSGRHHRNVSFEREGRTCVLTKHSRAAGILRALGPERFRLLRKFSVVRNPYSRTESIFRFLKYTWTGWDKSNAMDRFDTLDEFVTSRFFQRPGPSRMLQPQFDWLTDDKKNMCVDHLARLESLDRDIAEICDRLGLPQLAEQVEKKNISVTGPQPRHGANDLGGPAIDAIYRRYVRDFEAFGYSREPGNRMPAAAFD